MENEILIQTVSERLESIIDRYASNSDYCRIKKGEPWGYGAGKQILWTLPYEPVGASCSISFRYYVEDKLFGISGKRTEFSKRDPEEKRKDMDEALEVLEQRIREIPYEWKKIFKPRLGGKDPPKYIDDLRKIVQARKAEIMQED